MASDTDDPWAELRARHGLPPRPDENAPPSWRVLRDAAPLPERSDAASSALQARLLSRPYAFSAMTRGPAPYRDAESDELSVLWSFRVRTAWPDDVLAELEGLDPDTGLERMDLRDWAVCTIDGADAQDFDDAISFRRFEDGSRELGVHIADVSAFVRPGSALDDEALARATSHYLPDQVVPMLPESLSADLCSLRPDADRRCFSVFCRYDAQGHRQDTRFVRSLIRSRARLDYGQVQRFFDARTGHASILPAELHTMLRDLRLWTQQQQRRRDERGSLRVQGTERVLEFHQDGRPSKVVDAPRHFANTLIEECALAANQAVGDYLRRSGLPTLYRHHPEKDPEEVARILEGLAEHGLRVPKIERLSGRDIGDLVRAARRRPNAESLISRIMGLVERAEYRAFAQEDEARHFGLARRSYLHFTSPIRRYPDLVTHRLLARALRAEAGGRTPSYEPSELDELCEVAAHCSLRAWIAEQAERAVFDLLVREMLQPKVGTRVSAKLLRVSAYGLDVRLRNSGAGRIPADRSAGTTPRARRADPARRERHADPVLHRGARALGAHRGRGLPAAPGHPRAVMSRSISTVALLLGLCLVSCAQRPDPAPAPQRLRVVTYNIHHSRGVDGRVDTARIAALLGRIGADVVGLQEVDRGVRRTQGRDLARELATQLGMHFAFGKNLDYQGGDYGNALLSRFPIVRAENRHYDMLRVGEQRGVLDATLSVAWASAPRAGDPHRLSPGPHRAAGQPRAARALVQPGPGRHPAPTDGRLQRRAGSRRAHARGGELAGRLGRRSGLATARAIRAGSPSSGSTGSSIARILACSRCGRGRCVQRRATTSRSSWTAGCAEAPLLRGRRYSGARRAQSASSSTASFATIRPCSSRSSAVAANCGSCVKNSRPPRSSRSLSIASFSSIRSSGKRS